MVFLRVVLEDSRVAVSQERKDEAARDLEDLGGILIQMPLLRPELKEMVLRVLAVVLIVSFWIR
jgi:hypothetical protein